MGHGLSSLAVVLVLAASAAFGAAWLAAAAALLAVVVAVDLSLVVAGGRTRPVLPVAGALAVCCPLLVVGYGAAAWLRLGDVVAATLVGGLALVLVTGRRTDIVAGLSAALAGGVFAGVGAATLLLLVAQPDGLRWALALGTLVLAADVAGGWLAGVVRAAPVAPARRGRHRRRRAAALPRGTARAVLALAPTALAAIGIAVMLDPPVTPREAAVLGAAVLVVTAVATEFERRMRPETGDVQGRFSGRLGAGRWYAAADGVLLATPVAYVIVRSMTT